MDRPTKGYNRSSDAKETAKTRDQQRRVWGLLEEKNWGKNPSPKHRKGKWERLGAPPQKTKHLNSVGALRPLTPAILKGTTESCGKKKTCWVKAPSIWSRPQKNQKARNEKPPPKEEYGPISRRKEKNLIGRTEGHPAIVKAQKENFLVFENTRRKAKSGGIS